MKSFLNIAHRQLLMVIFFLMPIYIKLLPPLIVVFVLVSVLNLFLNPRDAKWKKEKWSILGLIGFYLFLIVSLLWSDNLSYGLKDLEIKLSLLIFPLIFGIHPSILRSKDVFRSFISGLVMGALIRWGRCIWIYFNENIWVTYKDFSVDIHPSYLSMYMVLGLILLIHVSSYIKTQKKYLIVVSTSIALLLLVSIFQLSSKMGMISVVIPFVYGSFILFTRMRSKVVSISLILCSITLFVYAFSNNTRLTGFVNQNNPSVESKLERKSSLESTAVRKYIWSSAFVQIKNNILFGVGTGDIKDQLIVQYQIDGLTGAAENKLNAHNQFLQVALAIGLVGLLFFLLQFTIPIYTTWQFRPIILILFSLLCCLNFCVESMLETQAGTIFFGLFNAYLCFNSDTK
ncbi:MAG TPA: O-antigen ligase family protein [Bacteroidia bacterium]|nr:O-antigen ligase family protein [Bacteroidia bacterium]HNT79216.1 O-antigen ligase family protein [Bacteroidia bacterium]